MAKYYFSLEDHTVHADSDGTELAGLDAARRASVRYLADLLKEKERDFWRDQRWRLTTADEKGLTLFCIEVCATDAPALSR